MNYETVKTLNDDDFKRAVGVQRRTFEKMLAVVEKGIRQFGRPTTLSRADQLLRTLMYWREYRTEFQIGLTFGVSESTVCRTLQKVETARRRSGQFRLPGKKALPASDTVLEVVVVAATEQPLERPKKNNARTIAAKRSVILKKRQGSSIGAAKPSSPRRLPQASGMISSCSKTVAVGGRNKFAV